MNLRKRALRFLVLIFAGDVCLLAIMAALVGLSDHLAAEARQSSIVVNNCVRGLTLVLDATQALGYHGLHRSPASQELFVKSVDDLDLGAEIFSRTIVKSPADKRLIDLLQNDFAVVGGLLTNIKKTIVEGIDTDLLTDYINRTRNIGTDKLVVVMPRIRQNFHLLISKYEKLVAADTNRVVALKNMLLTVIGLGAVANVITCYLAVRAFTTNITDRLSILCDNMDKMASGGELNSPVRGEDEIAELDKFFHRLDSNLKLASQRERTMLTGMPTGTITFPSSLMIAFVNPAFEKMTGFSRDIVGKPVSSIFYGERAPSQEQWNDQLIEQQFLGKVREIEIFDHRQKPLTVEMSIAKYTLATDHMYVCSILDMTERYQLEQVKREFVSIVSNDLRTPLTSIKHVLSIASDEIFGSISEEGKRSVTLAMRECDRLIGLISDLLSPGGVESGKLPLNRDHCSLDSIVNRAINAISNYAREQNINIEVRCSDLVLYADENRLIQVFVNLLSNAVKYSPQNTTIQVYTSVTAKDVQIAVTDQGIGIEQEAHQRIFERFAQARPEDEKTGSGLGLAICKLIVEDHHGTIEVESKPGHGSTFKVTLPQAPDNANGAG